MKTFRTLLSLVGSLGLGVSCSAHKHLDLHNDSDRLLESRRMDPPVRIEPGEVQRFPVAASRVKGVSVPFLEVSLTAHERYPALDLNGHRYALPEAYLADIEAWKERSWLGQRAHPGSEEVHYRSQSDVSLFFDGKEWPLEAEVDSD